MTPWTSPETETAVADFEVHHAKAGVELVTSELDVRRRLGVVFGQQLIDRSIDSFERCHGRKR